MARLENKKLTFEEECIHQSKSMRLFCDQQQFRGVLWQIPCYKWYHCSGIASAGLRLAQENFFIPRASKNLQQTFGARCHWIQSTLVAQIWQGLQKFPEGMMDNQSLSFYSQTSTKASLYARSGYLAPVLSRLGLMDIDFLRATQVSLRILHKHLMKVLSDLNKTLRPTFSLIFFLMIVLFILMVQLWK